MPHIHDQPGQFDWTASAYVFRTDQAEPMIMLHKHRKLGKYLQFGGHVELHEHPWATIIHELREESGYDISQLQLLQPPHELLHFSTDRAFAHPTPFSFGSHKFGDLDHYHTDVSFAFLADCPPGEVVSNGESNNFKLFTRQEIVKLTSPAKIPANARESILYAFEHVLDTWQPVAPTKFRS